MRGLTEDPTSDLLERARIGGCGASNHHQRAELAAGVYGCVPGCQHDAESRNVLSFRTTFLGSLYLNSERSKG